MIFEWDEKKNKANQVKHQISFENARYVFADPFAVTRHDECDTEGRQQIIGQINGLLMVLVVYTMRDRHQEEIIRIISARQATQAERRMYEEGNWF